MEPLLGQLVECDPHVRGSRPALSKVPGVYLFSESTNHIYVGITRDIQRRYRDHTSLRAPEYKASFAFKIARRDAELDDSAYVDRSRGELASDSSFCDQYFTPAKIRVREMDFRHIKIDPRTPDADALMTVFEVYASIALGTEGDFNLFRTH